MFVAAEKQGPCGPSRLTNLITPEALLDGSLLEESIIEPAVATEVVEFKKPP